ncbi:hypothetical protein V6C42_12815 [Pseudoclostridium thermosuccinogenes]|uniref:hypothetical protein n=1 Tax=Clostridium thermosuccinogenes TaxID=84032 RepID=UPI002FDB3F83
MKYIVTSPSEREITVDAKNSTQAKRIACKAWGIRTSDKWCGMSALRARRVKDEDNVKTLAVCLIAATSAIQE